MTTKGGNSITMDAEGDVVEERLYIDHINIVNLQGSEATVTDGSGNLIIDTFTDEEGPDDIWVEGLIVTKLPVGAKVIVHFS